MRFQGRSQEFIGCFQLSLLAQSRTSSQRQFDDIGILGFGQWFQNLESFVIPSALNVFASRLQLLIRVVFRNGIKNEEPRAAQDQSNKQILFHVTIRQASRR
eukprot:TRINITY_DN2006_c0_g1_i4.p3 TRINITY_DN2006_c0_g1~~TRINITY_DN2006_c0_g1_i4.p3  ORF type:complete len:102 (+),score=1.95 TRINITY_DN2006_c0_g1_i4:328-633(+)